MEFLFIGLLFVGFLAIYDVIRGVNKNILAQTEEIKKLREEIAKKK
ncbi:hypothetical protein [Pseudoneobacillus sp. C159]